MKRRHTGRSRSEVAVVTGFHFGSLVDRSTEEAANTKDPPNQSSGVCSYFKSILSGKKEKRERDDRILGVAIPCGVSRYDGSTGPLPITWKWRISVSYDVQQNEDATPSDYDGWQSLSSALVGSILGSGVR